MHGIAAAPRAHALPSCPNAMDPVGSIGRMDGDDAAARAMTVELRAKSPARLPGREDGVSHASITAPMAQRLHAPPIRHRPLPFFLACELSENRPVHVGHARRSEMDRRDAARSARCIPTTSSCVFRSMMRDPHRQWRCEVTCRSDVSRWLRMQDLLKEDRITQRITALVERSSASERVGRPSECG